MPPQAPSAAEKTEAWAVVVDVPVGAVAAFEDTLDSLGGVFSAFAVDEADPDNDLWRLQVTLESAPDHAAVTAAVSIASAMAGIAEPPVSVGSLGKRNWLAENREAFPILRIGRYFIHGSHHEQGPPPGALGILIDAATAFGSGKHDSTRGCLLAFDRLARRVQPRRPLDMGCGSGILAIAMAKTWGVPVVAVDVDPESVRVTAENAHLNGVGAFVTAFAGAGFKGGAVRRRRPYDLIAANILARPLRAMAVDLARALSPGGHAVLAGLMDDQERQVLNAYREQGLSLVEAIRLGRWTTLVLRKPT